jgi:tetratricopeptide (TPR) repeat protein
MLARGIPTLIAAVVMLTVAAFGTTDTGETRTGFDTANKLYEEGKFSDAAAAYERMLQGGVASPALYFNSGNAHFKAGRIGPAIAAYRRAEELAPRDPDVRANLRFARNQVQGPTLRVGLRERALGVFSLSEWSWFATAAFWGWLGLLVFRQVRPAARRSLRNWVFLAALLTLMVGAGLGWSLHARFYVQSAIVVVSDATVRNGPFEESPVAFTARDGAELRVRDQKDDWLQVTAGPRRIGWLPRAQVIVLPAR